jgi:hypothetical protein
MHARMTVCFSGRNMSIKINAQNATLQDEVVSKVVVRKSIKKSCGIFQ